MKICFINPPGPRYLYRGTICTYISKARYVWKPKDFILLSSVIPKDWEVSFLDAAINRTGTQEALNWAQNEKPDAVVLAMSSIVWPEDLNFLKKLKERLSTARIVVFGEIFLEMQFVQEALRWADAILYDPLRSNLEELVTQPKWEIRPYDFGKKETREIRTNVPRHTLFDNIKYRWPFVKHFRFASVYTQFGCPFSCSYCSEAVTKVTYRSADNVLQEMAYVKKEGYKELHIGDASFGYPRENAIAVLEGMIRENFGFIWSSYTYPGLADTRMLELMARSGCHTLVIGIDSADGALLQKYGRHVPQGKIRDFIANCKKLNIDVCGDLILGFKEDDRESCLRTIEMAVELDLDYASFNIATPMMGSVIRKELKEVGVLNSSEAGYDTAGLHEVKGTEQLNSQELVKLRNHAVKRFYLRPEYVWKRLKKSTSLEETLIKANEAFGIVRNIFKQEYSSRDGYL